MLLYLPVHLISFAVLSLVLPPLTIAFMRIRPFVISTLVSAAIQSVYYTIITAITLIILPPMMDTVIQDIPSSGGPPPGIFSFMGISVFIGIASLILAPLAYAATGALYARLHHGEEAPVTPEQGALGGALAAFVARFATGLFIAGASLLVSHFMMGTIMNAVGGSGAVPGLPPNFTVFSSVTSVFGSLVSTCFGSVIAAAIGGLGGALTGAILK